MKKESMKTTDLFSLEHTMAKSLLEKYEYPWEALAHIEEFVMKLGASLPEDEYMNPAKGIWVHRSAKIAPTAGIIGPVVIGPKAEIRHCAYIRGKVIVGAEAVVGNSSELKNTILFDNVQVPHYNYVGDSILGYKAHMGAGSITSNVKSDKTLVVVKGETDMPTGRKKMGAILGDFVEVGCNSVLNPGTILGRHSSVYPTSCVRGVVPANSIYKDKDHIVLRQEK